MAASASGDVREGLATVTRGTFLVSLSAFCLVLFTFFSRVLLVRTPAADWNSFSLELTLASILATVGTLGLPNAVARSLPYAATDSERRTIVRTSVLATLASALSLSVSLWIAAPYIARALGIDNLDVGLKFFSIAISTSLLAGLIAAIFRGFADVIPNALFIQTLSPGLFVAFLLAALATPGIGLRYPTALAAYAAANGVTLLLLVLYAARRLPDHLPSGGQAPEYRASLLRFTAPLFVSAVMLTLAGTGDTIVLGVYHSSEVGVYTASLTLARLVLIGIVSTSYIFLPVATQFLRRGNTRAVGMIYGTVTKWLVTISLPLTLLFVLLPQRSLGFVYGPAYVGVVLPLQLTVACAFAATVLGPAYAIQISYGSVGLVGINSAVSAGADVFIALLLVPRLGYTGAALAWGVATLLLASLSLAELAIMDGVHPFTRHFWVPLAATFVPVAFFLFGLRSAMPGWSLPLTGLLIAGAFVLVVLFSRSLDDGDRMFLDAVESLLGHRIPLVRRLARLAGNR